MTNGGYIMCVQFPDWDIPLVHIGDEGYLQYKEIFAGVDKWYDQNIGDFIPYNYDMIQLIDFLPPGETKTTELIMT